MPNEKRESDRPEAFPNTVVGTVCDEFRRQRRENAVEVSVLACPGQLRVLGVVPRDRELIGERRDRAALQEVELAVTQGAFDVDRTAHDLLELHREPGDARDVSFWPANDASPESSPIADDRTATRGSRSPTRLARSAYDAATSSCSRARAATSPSSAWRSSSNADTSRQKPGGTRKEVARRPRFAVFPPTVVASREPASPNQATCMAGESRSIAP